MSKREDRIYKEDILTSITKIEGYIKDMTFTTFQNDGKTVDAVIRNIEIIGEAARYFSDEAKEQYNNIPWQLMINMRNKVIHEYFGIDMEILWETVTKDIPSLKSIIIDLPL